MRGRKSGLLPLEVNILETGMLLRRQGQQEFHGFLAASYMRDAGEARLLTARGTLYKALERLQRGGMLNSSWEDPAAALAEGRPRRRLYRVTALGEAALSEARASVASVVPRLSPDGSTS